MQLNCPKCKRVSKIATPTAGSQIVCPGCHAAFVVGQPASKSRNAASDDEMYGVKEDLARPSSSSSTSIAKENSQYSSATMIEAQCSRCETATRVEASRGGQRMECPTCGDPIYVPTLKQFKYQEGVTRRSRRFWLLAFVGIVLFVAGLVTLGLFLDYQESQIPDGVARIAWRASHPVAAKHVTIEQTTRVASDGELSIYRIRASSREKAKKLQVDAPIVEITSYVVVRGLTAVEVVSSDRTILDDLKTKYKMK